jgi:hypothetical protein
MNDDIDIEKTLRGYRSDPGDQVKRSVMSRFKNTHGNRRSETRHPALWKKSVPLYLYAATLVVAVGLAFFVGQRTAPLGRQQGVTNEPLPEMNTVEVQEIQWESAPNDVL